MAQLTAAALLDIDALLDHICESLQLTPTQFEQAERSYNAIGEWLDTTGSPLSGLRPRIYPQGSMRLRTTVKPRESEEFDLDLVCELDTSEPDPMKLFELVAARIEAHGTYGPMSRRLKRCIRLEYQSQFHLDILPARPDHSRPAGCLLVPDRKLRDWKPSNPKGYAQWFDKTATELVLAKRADAEPLPAPERAEDKPTLKRTVQLLKRHRDVVFDGDEDNAPRSVVLTTLAATHYAGSLRIADAVQEVLLGIERQISSTSGIMKVLNPTNPAENFAEAWNEESYGAFIEFVQSTRAAFGRLSQSRGLVQVKELSDQMFGSRPTTAAINAIEERLSEERGAGRLHLVQGIGLTAVSGGRPVRRNTFFGA